MTSRHTGRTYALSIAPPTDPVMAPAPTAGYPLVIVLDARGSFGTALESLQLRSLLGELSPAVIMGVGYDADPIATMRLRTRDLTPPTPGDRYPELAALMGDEFGGSSAFLAFLIEEAISEIATRFRLDPRRITLYGHSLGGLFVLETLLRRPDAFATYAAVSPSLWWNDFATLALKDGFHERLGRCETPPSVFLGVGSREEDAPADAPPGMDLDAIAARVRAARMIGAAEEFAGWLKDIGLSRVSFFSFEAETHNSVVPAGIARSLTFALQPGA